MPIARNPDGSSVTGRVVQRFVNVAGNMNTQSLPGAGRMPATLDTTSAKLISATSETPAGVKGGVREDRRARTWRSPIAGRCRSRARPIPRVSV